MLKVRYYIVVISYRLDKKKKEVKQMLILSSMLNFPMRPLLENIRDFKIQRRGL